MMEEVTASIDDDGGSRGTNIAGGNFIEVESGGSNLFNSSENTTTISSRIISSSASENNDYSSPNTSENKGDEGDEATNKEEIVDKFKDSDLYSMSYIGLPINEVCLVVVVLPVQ